MTTKIPGNMLQNGFTASAPQYLTASGTYTPSANCRAVLIDAVNGNVFGSGGGGSPLGAGGIGSTNAVGAVATGYGAGAHGLAKGFSSAAAAGVAGTAGVIRVTEFF